MKLKILLIVACGIVWIGITIMIYHFMDDSTVRKSLLAITAMFFGGFLKEAFDDIGIIRRNKKSKTKAEKDD